MLSARYQRLDKLTGYIGSLPLSANVPLFTAAQKLGKPPPYGAPFASCTVSPKKSPGAHARYHHAFFLRLLVICRLRLEYLIRFTPANNVPRVFLTCGEIFKHLMFIKTCTSYMKSFKRTINARFHHFTCLFIFIGLRR
jgi:hypothetical protein